MENYNLRITKKFKEKLSKTALDTVDGENLLKGFMIAGGNTDLMKSFLLEILTKKEISQSIQRFKAAEMLITGASYKTVEKITNLSSKTIARLNKLLIQSSGFYQIIRNLHPRGFRYFE